jgi:1-acyl-sn-glycerol-3-phosphate acyltransferase
MTLRSFFRLLWATAYTFWMCFRALWGVAWGASDDQVREWTRVWAAGLARRMRIEVLAQGMEDIDWSMPCIIMANHQSYLDVLALYHALPRPFGIVAKKQLFAIPLFGGIMRALGCVPVDRSKLSHSMSTLKDAAARVREGATIAVFPEGTRSPGDRIADLKKGPFYLAQLAEVSVIPIGIRGSAALMPRQNTGIRPGTIEVHVGARIAPVPPDNAEARKQLMAQVRAELSRLAAVPIGDG